MFYSLEIGAVRNYGDPRTMAALARRPLDEAIAQTLQVTLLPLLEDIPPAFRPDLAHLETWSNEALHRQVFAKVDKKSSTRYAKLLKKTNCGLNPERRARTDRFTHSSRSLDVSESVCRSAVKMAWRTGAHTGRTRSC